MKSGAGKRFLIRNNRCWSAEGDRRFPARCGLPGQCSQVSASSSWECGFFSSHSGSPCFFR